MGECAGVMIDLVQTLLYEAEEKLNWAEEAIQNNAWADSIYHSYAGIISTAKSLLLDKNVNCNTHAGIIADFDKHFVADGLITVYGTFSDFILQINKQEPNEIFAKKYLQDARGFYALVNEYREKQIVNS